MRRGIPDNELALAYELRQAGITWKWIAYGLGVSWRALRTELQQRIAGQLEDPRTKTPRAIVEAATLQRRTSRLSWRAIAAHYGVDPAALRFAVARRCRPCSD